LVRNLPAHTPFWCSGCEAKAVNTRNTLFLFDKNIGTDSAKSQDVTGSAVHKDVEKLVHALTQRPRKPSVPGSGRAGAKSQGAGGVDDLYLALCG
jgi:hypothetical protein